MSHSFNFLLTKKLLCKDYTNLVKNDINFNSYKEKSIFDKYYDEVKKMIDTSKYNNNIDSNIDLKKLNNIYEDLKTDLDINNFCKKLFKLRTSLSSKFNLESNIQEIFNKFKNLNNNSNKKNNNIIVNPLYNSYLNINNFNSSNFINNYQRKNLLININILTQGKYINVLYPTLGIIEKSTKTNLYTNNINKIFVDIVSLFNSFLYKIYYEFEMEYNFYLPIQFLNFGNTICKILNESNNIGNISSIKDYINTIEIGMEDVMIIKETKK